MTATPPCLSTFSTSRKSRLIVPRTVISSAMLLTATVRISFALAKGRGRYLCPYRLYQITQNSAQKDLGFETPFQFLPKSKTSKEDKALLHEIADSFEQRIFDGDRDSWTGDTISIDLWQKINNDRHSCLKNDCPNRAECPFFKAREVLDSVDIIVANHDLLLSDIDMGGGVILPPPINCFYCISHIII